MTPISSRHFFDGTFCLLGNLSSSNTKISVYNVVEINDKVFLILFFADKVEVKLKDFDCEGVVQYSINPGNQSGYFCAESFGMQSHTSYSITGTNYLDKGPDQSLVSGPGTRLNNYSSSWN